MSLKSDYYSFGNQQKKPWKIMKQIRLTCFGDPGYVLNWVDYSSHDTEDEAKEQLAKLNNFADPLAYEKYKIVSARQEIWNAR